MKSLNKLFLLITSILISSCTSNDITENLTEGINQIRFTASDFKYTNNSRTAFTISNNGAEFKWAENDTVGIFPNTGSQVYFPMQSGAGTKTATFDGGGWALKSSSTYAAYYPFKGDMYLDKTIIPVSYVGQKQVGNNSTEHLGTYDYMAAVASTPENGNVDFNFKHLGCLVQLNIPLESACSITSIILRTEDKSFVTKGYLDLTSSISINNLEYSDVFNLSVKEMSFSETNQEATVYFMMAPINLTDKKVIVQIYTKEEYLPLSYSFIGKNFKAGSAYSLNATINTIIDNSPAEPIDLGLPSGIKWASCNVGATKPEEYGDYYAWGEVEEKDSYDKDNYKYFEYVTNESGFTIENWINIGSEISGTEYDVVHVKWGGKWRIPTREEFNELTENCTFTWSKYNDVYGALFTSKINGNWIFLPACGQIRNKINSSPSSGHYSSGTRYDDYNGFTFEFYSNGASWGPDYFIGRTYGNSIRPVTE